MKLFKLVKNEDVEKKDINHIKIYESENYKLRIFTYNSGYISVDANRNEVNKKDYIPALYIRQNDDNMVEEIEIETCSYGSLNSEQVKEMIEKYKIAIDSVIELKEELDCNDLLKK